MRLAVACLILVTGCDLYFTNGGDDDVCAVDAQPPDELLRNPETGQCEAWGGFPCDGVCGPCAELLAPTPDWGSCASPCEALDETSCIDQAGCRAVYDANSNVDQAPQFLACWAIAPSGPAPGSCDGLDAQECSRHDNCAAFYDDDDNGFLVYRGCQAEQVKGCFADEECGPAAHCSVSDGECLPAPGCDAGQGCPAVCYGRCVADADVCATADCAPGTHCEAQCQGGGTGDPYCSPACVPDQDLCATMDCAPGTECVQTCQDTGGCGVCTAQCVPLGMCESLTTEASCVARADCEAVYTGEDCTCYSNGTCECAILDFARCQPD